MHRLVQKVPSWANVSVENYASLAGGPREREAIIPGLLQFWSVVTENICLSDKKGGF